MIEETILNQKGDIMLERAENQFWAYRVRMNEIGGLMKHNNL